ncbi:MAG: pantetheine-phosphate adenylyltransferase [Eubacterium sp.]|nr:pantetheine-phosphate adenylyltransferase [Eubacterium sp.]
MSKALYTGSFDPITNGHLDIIRRASHMFDELVVGVIVNPRKNCLFTKEERAEMIREITSDLPNVTVDCFQGLLADYANENKFDAVIRGLRATSDFEYEIQMAQMNAHLFRDGTDSVFLMTSPEYSFISSTMIKEVVSLGGDVTGLVPECILKRMIERYKMLNGGTK